MHRSRLALNGQSNRTRVCPLLDQSRQRWILARNGLSAFDPKRTFAHILSCNAGKLHPACQPATALLWAINPSTVWWTGISTSSIMPEKSFQVPVSLSLLLVIALP